MTADLREPRELELEPESNDRERATQQAIALADNPPLDAEECTALFI